MASEEGTARASRSRRWVAFFLELGTLPGLGHYVLGSTRAALAWGAAVTAPGLGLAGAALAASRSFFWALCVVHVLGRLLSGLHCLRQPARVAPGAWRATAVVLAVTITATLLNEYLVASRLKAFHHTAGSMYPLISEGDRIYARMGVVAAPSRGDVVVLMLPGAEDALRVKRIVALPGDTVLVDGLSVIVNQTPLPQERVAEACVGMATCTLWEETNGDARYTISADDSHVRSAPFGPITVPDDSVFVLGDNRDNSLDSRHQGPVPLTDVLGTFLMIWLPAAWLGSE